MQATLRRCVSIAAPLAGLAAVACQLTAMKFHALLLVAAGGDRGGFAAQTDWFSNVGLLLAFAAAAMACAGVSRRGSVYSLLLSVVAMALYFVR